MEASVIVSFHFQSNRDLTQRLLTRHNRTHKCRQRALRSSNMVGGAQYSNAYHQDSSIALIHKIDVVRCCHSDVHSVDFNCVEQSPYRVTQAVKKYLEFYGNRMFTTVLTKSQMDHNTSQINQSTASHHI
jgi:hypothetical protein